MNHVRMPEIGEMMSSGYMSHPLYHGTIAHWPFFEGGGTILHDISGRGANGTLTNMSVSADWEFARHGKTLDFDGVNDHIRTTFVTPTVSPMTILLNFMLLATPSEFETLLGNFHQSPARQIALRFRTGGSGRNMEFSTYNGTSTGIINVDVGIALNTWYFCAAVHDGSTYKLYIDGILKATTTSSTFTPSAQNLYIGARHDAQEPEDDLHVNAKIDNVRILDRAYSDSEVMQVYIDPHVMFRPDPVLWKAPAAAGVNAPTGTIYGPLYGPLGGPV